MKTNTEIRKYIKEAIEANHPVKEIETIIDIVKQDMVEEFDSRICDNCQFIRINTFTRHETATCTNENSRMFDSDVGDNWGCSDFKRKVK